jgi:Haem-degrading
MIIHRLRCTRQSVPPSGFLRLAIKMGRKMKMQRCLVLGSLSLGISLLACPAFADAPACSGLPSQGTLRNALVAAVGTFNGGLGFNMWATLVANDGTVCAVAFSSGSYTDQWFLSRVISAQKANTASGLSLSASAPPSTANLFKNGLALSTANLYSAVQPGGSLYGLQHSNPVDTTAAYPQGNAALFGTAQDPMVGTRIGGVNVFGGGFALYKSGVKVGGVGVSGDTSCADHNVGWRVRNSLGLDKFGAVGADGGVAGDVNHPDNIIFDITPNPDGGTGISKGGFGHPPCPNSSSFDVSTLPKVTH